MNTIYVMFLSAIVLSSFMLGYMLQNGFAQNSTVPAGSTAGVFGTELGLTIGVITSLIIAITGLVKLFPLDTLTRKFVTAVADGAHATYDERNTFGKIGGLLASMTPEQAQDYIKNVITPAIKELGNKGAEYLPKVVELTELAAKYGKPLSTINFGRKFEVGDKPAYTNSDAV